MSKLDKTIARQKQRISEGQYYEAHQQLRVIASRYLKASPPNYNAAFDLLSSGAQALFSAGQGGSGGDLCLYLIDAYKQADLKPDVGSKGRVLGLLRAFPEGEPTKKRYVQEMVGWSAKNGEFPAGDPELHHVAGQLYAEAGEPYEAERHLTLGTRDSVPTLAHMEYDWYSADEPATAAEYLARAILPLLLAGNFRGANQALLLFTSRLSQSNPSLSTQQVSGASSDLRIYPSLPLVNFLTLLLLAVQRGSSDLFRTLTSQYKMYIAELDGAWDTALQGIGESYFGMRAPRQGNPLMDMMSSMFMGGGGGGGSGQPKPKTQKVQAPAPPPALD